MNCEHRCSSEKLSGAKKVGRRCASRTFFEECRTSEILADTLGDFCCDTGAHISMLLLPEVPKSMPEFESYEPLMYSFDSWNPTLRSTHCVMHVVDDLNYDILNAISRMVLVNTPKKELRKFVLYCFEVKVGLNLNTMRMLVMCYIHNVTIDQLLRSHLDSVLTFYTDLLSKPHSEHRYIFRLLHLQQDFMIPKDDVLFLAAKTFNLMHVQYFYYLGYQTWPGNGVVPTDSLLCRLISCCRKDPSGCLTKPEVAFLLALVDMGLPLKDTDMSDCGQPVLVQALVDKGVAKFHPEYLKHCLVLSRAPQGNPGAFYNRLNKMICIGIKQALKWSQDSLQYLYNPRVMFAGTYESHLLEKMYVLLLSVGCPSYLTDNLADEGTTIAILLRIFRQRDDTNNVSCWYTHREYILSYLNDFCCVFEATVERFGELFKEFRESKWYNPDRSKLQHWVVNEEVVTQMCNDTMCNLEHTVEVPVFVHRREPSADVSKFIDSILV